MKRFEIGEHYGFDGGDVIDVKDRTQCYVTIWTPETGERRCRVTVEPGDDVERVRVGCHWYGADREVGPEWSDDAERTLAVWLHELYLGLPPNPTVVERVRDLAWDVAYNMGHGEVTPEDVEESIRHTRPLLPYIA